MKSNTIVITKNRRVFEELKIEEVIIHPDFRNRNDVMADSHCIFVEKLSILIEKF